MALDNSRKVIDQGNVVVYSRQRQRGTWVNVFGNITTTFDRCWKYTRDCSCKIRYVGLTEAEAASYVSELQETFTRSQSLSVWDSNREAKEFFDQTVTGVLMAEISMQPTVGDMWEVSISVREHDEKNRMAKVTPSSLFSTEDRRSYLGA